MARRSDAGMTAIQGLVVPRGKEFRTSLVLTLPREVNKQMVFRDQVDPCFDCLQSVGEGCISDLHGVLICDEPVVRPTQVQELI